MFKSEGECYMKIPDEFAHRHPATLQVFQFFAYDHLPEGLQSVSKNCYTLAVLMMRELPDSPELTAGLRKLLEAKDCFVRTAVSSQPGLIKINNQDMTPQQYEDFKRNYMHQDAPLLPQENNE